MKIIQCAFLQPVSALVYTFLLLLSFTFIKHFYLVEVIFRFALQQAATISELIILTYKYLSTYNVLGCLLIIPAPILTFLTLLIH
jgi:hypothetical protein